MIIKGVEREMSLTVKSFKEGGKWGSPGATELSLFRFSLFKRKIKGKS